MPMATDTALAVPAHASATRPLSWRQRRRLERQKTRELHRRLRGERHAAGIHHVQGLVNDDDSVRAVALARSQRVPLLRLVGDAIAKYVRDETADPVSAPKIGTTSAKEPRQDATIPTGADPIRTITRARVTSLLEADLCPICGAIRKPGPGRCARLIGDRARVVCARKPSHDARWWGAWGAWVHMLVGACSCGVDHRA